MALLKKSINLLTNFRHRSMNVQNYNYMLIIHNSLDKSFLTQSPMFKVDNEFRNCRKNNSNINSL